MIFIFVTLFFNLIFFRNLERMNIKSNFLKVFFFLLVLWIIFILQVNGSITTANFVVDKYNGIISIFTGVFLHGSYDHVAGNTSALLITMPLLLQFYKKESRSIIFLGMFFPSLVCYVLNLKVYGISGLVFSVMWFLVLAGFTSRNIIKLITAIILSIFYLKMLMIGITPGAGRGIAWQAHLGGFIVAISVLLQKKSYP